MSKFSVLTVVGLCVAGAVIAYKVNNQRKYETECDKWKKRVTLDDALKYEPRTMISLDMERLSGARDIESYYTDVIHDYFRKTLADCSEPLDENAETFIAMEFDALRTRIKDISAVCETAVCAELSLLSDAKIDYLTKDEYIGSKKNALAMRTENMLGYTRTIEQLISQKVKQGTLSDEDAAELVDAIASFNFV